MGQTLDESIRYYTECKVLTFREKCDPLAAVGKEIHRLFQRPVRGPSRSYESFGVHLMGILMKRVGEQWIFFFYLLHYFMNEELKTDSRLHCC